MMVLYHSAILGVTLVGRVAPSRADPLISFTEESQTGARRSDAPYQGEKCQIENSCASPA